MSMSIAMLLQQVQAQGMARMDAQLLMLCTCGHTQGNRAWLIAHDQDCLNPAQLELWQAVTQRRLQGEPVAYITGYKEFYGLPLTVNAAVLDPRDDTETLVDWALELTTPDSAGQLLDLGTGSGAIALALKSQRPFAQISATDASPQALAVAQANAKRLLLEVNFVLTQPQEPNWFSPLSNQRFDLIVSNPPYIAENDPHLARLTHEPELALTSGADGLTAIRQIISHAAGHLKPSGWLLFEHGYDQAAQVRALLAEHHFTQISSRCDLAGHERCTGGRLLS